MLTKSDMRTWLNENGFETGSRGRFSREMIAAWNSSHPDSPYESLSASIVVHSETPSKPFSGDPEARPVGVVLERVCVDPETSQTVLVADGETLTRGVLLTIRDEPGTFKFLNYVSRENGEWITVYGGEGYGLTKRAYASCRSFTPDRIASVVTS
jgi:hypothetical protein